MERGQERKKAKAGWGTPSGENDGDRCFSNSPSNMEQGVSDRPCCQGLTPRPEAVINTEQLMGAVTVLFYKQGNVRHGWIRELTGVTQLVRSEPQQSGGSLGLERLGQAFYWGHERTSGNTWQCLETSWF